MNKDTILGIIRHILTFGGGALVTKGFADSQEVDQLAGAIMTIIGVVWSIIQKRSAMKGTVAILLACLLPASLALSLTACKSPEHAMLATAQAQHQTVKSALKQWNAFLGAEYSRLLKLPGDEGYERSQELKERERKIKNALDDYNRAVATARIAVDAYFDIKAGLNNTNAPPDLGGQVTAYLDAITEAETAIINLVALYAK